MSETLKTNESAPNALSFSATINITYAFGSRVSTMLGSLVNGSFVVITADAVLGFGRIYGLYYGLSATGVDRSSADNGGWYTVTLETPEQVIGEDALYTSKEAYDALFATASY